MVNKTYNNLEIAYATELECFQCGKKEQTDPALNRLPFGWRRELADVLNKELGAMRIAKFICNKCDVEMVDGVEFVTTPGSFEKSGKKFPASQSLEENPRKEKIK